MLRRSKDTQIDGRILNQALGLPVIRYEVIKGKMGKIASWGVKKQAVVAILEAFKSEKPEPDAAYMANLLKTALESQT